MKPAVSMESSLLIVVPEAEPAVHEHRAQFDLAARVGVPAHITVSYPFKPLDVLTASDFGWISPSCRDASEIAHACAGYFAQTDPSPNACAK